MADDIAESEAKGGRQTLNMLGEGEEVGTPSSVCPEPCRSDLKVTSTCMEHMQGVSSLTKSVQAFLPPLDFKENMCYSNE